MWRMGTADARRAIYATSYTQGETVDIPDWTELATMSEVKVSINDRWRSVELAAITSRRGSEPSATGGGVRLGVPVVMLGSAVAAVLYVAGAL
jgi:hypothetical protein